MAARDAQVGGLVHGWRPGGAVTWYAYTPWVWPVLASAVFIGSVSTYLWRRRDVAGARPLSLAGYLVALLCLVVAVQVSTAETQVVELTHVVGDALMLPAAALALWFALEYASLNEWLTRPVALLLGALVGLRLILVPVDMLLVRSGQPPLVDGSGSVPAVLGATFAVIGLALLLLASAVFVLLYVRSPAHRVPVALILVGQVGVRVAYVAVSFSDADPTLALAGVLAFDVLSLMYAVALVRFRLFDLVPVARDRIVERMPDPILVLDRWQRVADLNPAAERMLTTTRQEACGKPVNVVLGPFPGLLSAVIAPESSPIETALDVDKSRSCEVRAATLTDWRGTPIGRLVVLHDITELRTAEELVLQHERALTTMHERVHMARDLHDTIGPVLAYVGMQADAARRLLASGRSSEVDTTLRRLGEVAREAHRDVRGYIVELNAGPPEAQPLDDALRRYLERYADNYGIHTDLHVKAPMSAAGLSGEKAVEVFRVVQEAVTNARRHGEAGTVHVAIEGDGSCTRVSVTDDGCGFEVGQVDGRGFGLRSMHDRAVEIGGRLDIQSGPGAGTRVTLEIPPTSAQSASSAEIDQLVQSEGGAA